MSTKDALDLFRASYENPPVLAASAPGRVNLIGEHTDYNGGPVLPLALRVRTTVVAGQSREWTVASSIGPGTLRIDPDGALEQAWTDYLVGCIRALRHIGAAPNGALLAIASDVPVGAGLSSSAALCVSVVKALSLLAGKRLAPEAIADAAYRAEHDEVGVKCGRMDQTVATFARSGSALLFETGSGMMKTVPMPGKVWILETGVAHRLVGGELNQRRRECEEALANLREHGFPVKTLADLTMEQLERALPLLPPSLQHRVRHVVTETARTRQAADRLLQRDLVSLGGLLVEGHESLRVDFQSTVPEADFLVHHAMGLGAYGARLTGAGWGGAVIMLCPEERERRIVAELSAQYEKEFGRAPAIWWSKASPGARRERVE